MSVAAVFSAATVVNSCKSELGEAKKINLDETPSQVVEGIFHIQSQNGLLQLRVEADRMERYVNDSVSYEIFPEGFNVFVYNEEGLLETEITSLNAMHSKSDEDGENWGTYEEELGYINYMINTAGSGRRWYSVYSTYYVAGYGDGGDVLQQYCAREPLFIISQAYFDSSVNGNARGRVAQVEAVFRSCAGYGLIDKFRQRKLSFIEGVKKNRLRAKY